MPVCAAWFTQQLAVTPLSAGQVDRGRVSADQAGGLLVVGYREADGMKGVAAWRARSGGVKRLPDVSGDGDKPAMRQSA